MSINIPNPPETIFAERLQLAIKAARELAQDINSAISGVDSGLEFYDADLDFDYLMSLVDRVQDFRLYFKDVTYAILRSSQYLGLQLTPTPPVATTTENVELLDWLIIDAQQVVRNGKDELLRTGQLGFNDKLVAISISDLAEFTNYWCAIFEFIRKVYTKNYVYSNEGYILTGTGTFAEVMLACTNTLASIGMDRIQMKEYLANSAADPKGIMATIMRIGDTSGALSMVSLITNRQNWTLIPDLISVDYDAKLILLNNEDERIATTVTLARDIVRTRLKSMASRYGDIPKPFPGACPAHATINDFQIIQGFIERGLQIIPVLN